MSGVIARLRRLRQAFALRSAARVCATELRSRLSRDYGRSQYYTGGQVRVAAGKYRLQSDYLYLAYATFLPEMDFLKLVPGGDYHGSRTLVKRFSRNKAIEAFDPPVPNSDALAGAGFDPSHHN